MTGGIFKIRHWTELGSNSYILNHLIIHFYKLRAVIHYHKISSMCV